jgi:putative NADH-flavin reductase
MRLLVLGASGQCGQWLVRLAVERGHEVTASVRAETHFPLPDTVRVTRGQVTDPAVVDDILSGQDAVVSALGLRRAGLSPWSSLRSPPDLTSRVAALLVAAMPRYGVRRILAISAGGVGDSEHQLTWPVKGLVRAGNVGVAYRDLSEMERTFANSSLDWCVARPVTLVNGPPRRPAHSVERYGLTSRIRRSEVAAWMLAAIERPTPFTDRQVLLGH